MSGAGKDILEALAKVSARMEALDTKFDRLLAALASRPAPAGAPPPGGAVADDRDLDSEYGNFVIRKDPPRWKGDSYVGCHLSECPADYLDSLAGFLDWKAGKDAEKGTPDGDKYAGYARKDAARARGWAARVRAGLGTTSAPVAESPAATDADDDIPF